MKELIEVKDVAKLLECSKPSVKAMVANGKLENMGTEQKMLITKASLERAFPNKFKDGQVLPAVETPPTGVNKEQSIGDKVGVVLGVKGVTPEIEALQERQNRAIEDRKLFDLEKETLEAERKLAEEKKLRDLPEMLAEQEEALNSRLTELEQRETDLATDNINLESKRTDLQSWNEALKAKELELLTKETDTNTYDLTKRAETDTYCEAKMNELSQSMTNQLQAVTKECDDILKDAETKKMLMLKDTNTEVNSLISQVNLWANATIKIIDNDKKLKKIVDGWVEKLPEDMEYLKGWVGWAKKHTKDTKGYENFVKAVDYVKGTLEAIHLKYLWINESLGKMPDIEDYKEIPIVGATDEDKKVG